MSNSKYIPPHVTAVMDDAGLQNLRLDVAEDRATLTNALVKAYRWDVGERDCCEACFRAKLLSAHVQRIK